MQMLPAFVIGLLVGCAITRLYDEIKIGAPSVELADTQARTILKLQDELKTLNQINEDLICEITQLKNQK